MASGARRAATANLTPFPRVNAHIVHGPLTKGPTKTESSASSNCKGKGFGHSGEDRVRFHLSFSSEFRRFFLGQEAKFSSELGFT